MPIKLYIGLFLLISTVRKVHVLQNCSIVNAHNRIMNHLHAKANLTSNELISSTAAQNFTSPINLRLFGVKAVYDSLHRVVVKAYLLYKQDITHLRWDPRTYCGISQVYIRQGDAFGRLFHRLAFKSFSLHSIDTEIDSSHVRIKSTGETYSTLFPISDTRLNCQLDMYYFPMDTHICYVEIIPQDMGQVPPDPFCLLYKDHDLHETWDLLACDTDPSKNFPTFRILIRRRSSYFMISQMWPTLLLTHMLPTVFLMRGSDERKTTVAGALITVMYIFLAEVTSTVPTGSVPAILVYILLTMFQSCVALAVAALFQLTKEAHENAARKVAPIPEIVYDSAPPILRSSMRTIPSRQSTFHESSTITVNQVSSEDVQNRSTNKPQHNWSQRETESDPENKLPGLHSPLTRSVIVSVGFIPGPSEEKPRSHKKKRRHSSQPSHRLPYTMTNAAPKNDSVDYLNSGHLERDNQAVRSPDTLTYTATDMNTSPLEEQDKNDLSNLSAVSEFRVSEPILAANVEDTHVAELYSAEKTDSENVSASKHKKKKKHKKNKHSDADIEHQSDVLHKEKIGGKRKLTVQFPDDEQHASVDRIKSDSKHQFALVTSASSNVSIFDYKTLRKPGKSVYYAKIMETHHGSAQNDNENTMDTLTVSRSSYEEDPETKKRKRLSLRRSSFNYSTRSIFIPLRLMSRLAPDYLNMCFLIFMSFILIVMDIWIIATLANTPIPVCSDSICTFMGVEMKRNMYSTRV